MAIAVLLVFLSLAADPHAQTTPAIACDGLAQRTLPDTTISAAQAVTTGSFTPPGSTNAIANLPPFCRVAGVIAPTRESQILFEVWMPLEKWNGKFAGVGNGGWAGMISYGRRCGDQLRRGYAAASTNTGHEAAPGLEHGAVRVREAGTADRLRVPLASRNGAARRRRWSQAFYGKPPDAVLFHRLLVGRVRRA